MFRMCVGCKQHHETRFIPNPHRETLPLRKISKSLKYNGITGRDSGFTQRRKINTV